MRKRIFIGIATISIAFSTQAQSWFDMGVKAAWGPSILYNQTILDDIDYNNVLNYGYSFGGKIGYNFDDRHQVTVDLMSSSFKGSFIHNKPNPNNEGTLEHSALLQTSSLDIMTLYRSNNNGGYFEIGPQYSMVSKATFDDKYHGMDNTNIEDKINKGLFGLVMGFGGYFMGSDNFGVTLGCRFNYTISDLANSSAQSENFPTFSNERSYKGNHPFTAMLIMEFNYDLGYLAGPKCGKRKKLILF